MPVKSSMTRTLNLIGALVLLVGLGSAVGIYATASDEARDIIGYDQGYGSAYGIRPEDSKAYQRSLELYGGKANALADELRRWFVGLWHGKRLAYTTAAITVFLCAGLFFVANYLLPLLAFDPGSGARGDDAGQGGS